MSACPLHKVRLLHTQKYISNKYVRIHYAHGSRGLSLCLLGPRHMERNNMAVGAGGGKASSPHDGQKEARARLALQRYAHSDLLSTGRSCSQSFQPLSKTAPCVDNQTFSTWVWGGPLMFKSCPLKTSSLLILQLRSTKPALAFLGQFA